MKTYAVFAGCGQADTEMKISTLHLVRHAACAGEKKKKRKIIKKKISLSCTSYDMLRVLVPLATH